MTEKRAAKQKKAYQSRRRAMDADSGRQAQLWWMFGVGLLLLVSAYYQKTRPILAQSERGPAQAFPADAARGLPSSEVRSR